MRLIPLLMIALLLMGFASRPSVVAALSSGHVLIEVAAESVNLGAVTEEVQAAPGSDIRITVAKCVPLGILPCSLAVPAQVRASVSAPFIVARAPPDYAYRFLRPPRA